MDVASPKQESSLTTKSSSPKQNNVEEKHEFGLGDVKHEPMDVTSPIQENILTMQSSSFKKNILEQHEAGLGDVQSEGCESMDVSSPRQGNSFIRKIPVPVQNILQEKHDSGYGDVQTEITNPSSQRVEDSLITNSSCPKHNILEQKHECGSGDLQSKALEVSSQTQENSLTIETSSLKQTILEQKHESGFGDVQIAANITFPIRENSPTAKSSEPEKNILEQNCESRFGVVKSEAICMTSPTQENSLTTRSLSPKNIVEQKLECGSGDVQNEALETRNAVLNFVDDELLARSGNDEILETPGNMRNNSGTEPKKSRVSSKSKKKNYMLRSSPGSARVLRSRLSDTPKVPDPVSVSVNVNTEIAKKRKKRKKTSKKLNNVFEKTKKRVRYLLNRSNYEHSLIEAYSGDGWKGQSAEKVKPEKELQRATSEILRCKQKIRDLFQHIDTLCAEGRFQESLFDSEGLIDSEDIFCAKCGSKELSTDNDIILCDGVCMRGFHQKCLDPPLLNEEIPPGDEGWLCPGCDCKVDCIDLLNDYLGTNLSVDDSWEKVFPEAAITASGNEVDDNFGLPSDDSEDDDYDPDSPDVVEKEDGKEEEEGSSSDESDFTSASDDSEDLPHKDAYLGLPSDDSGDDDYDPNAQDIDEQINKESSSSDFTSDSGDSAPLSDDGNGSLGAAEIPMPSSVDGANPLPGSGHRRPTESKRKKEPINSELRSIVEQGNASPVSGRRHRECLDYKMLHDETYGNVPSDSSDDEDWIDDWMDADGQGKRKKNYGGKESVLSSKENSRTNRSGVHIGDADSILRKTENNQQRRTRQKLECGSAKYAVSGILKDSDLIEKRVSEAKTPGKSVAQKTHGNVDSGDDEDWMDVFGWGKRKKDDGGKESVLSSKENSKVVGSGVNSKNTKSTSKKKENTRDRGTHQKLKFGGANNTASDTVKEGLEPDTVEKRASASKRLGKAVTQRLFEALKEKEYPTQETKIKLAEELGLTARQVNKWFDNTRWSLRHPGGRKSRAAPSKNVKLVRTNGIPEPEPNNLPNSNTASSRVQERESSGAVNVGAIEIESTPQKLMTPTLRNKKRNSIVDNKVLEEAETPIKPNNPTGSNRSQTPTRRSSRRITKQEGTQSQIQTRSRNSVG